MMIYMAPCARRYIASLGLLQTCLQGTMAEQSELNLQKDMEGNFRIDHV
jgi:hypothetical protein